jgi:integrase
MIHVNKSMKHLMVNRQYQPVLSPTKTANSMRDIPILNAIQKLLRAHIRHEKGKHLRLGIPFSDESILFSSSSCTYREGANVRKGFLRLCRELGMEETTFHSLRHTFCTILAKQGVPLKTTSVLMGHSDISVTAQIYTHVDNQEMKKGIEKLSVYFEH